MVKTALVTGSAGFVGRHIVSHLDTLGWNVDLCDIKYDDLSPFHRDANWVFSTNGKKYDLVFHCAYHIGGRVEIDGKPANLHLNAQLDANLFEWAVRTRQRRIVYFSSSAAYPIDHQRDIGDRRLFEGMIDLLNPRQPDGRYGWAKLHGEHLAQAARECGVPVTVLRPFSGYGGDQDSVYPFPAFIDRAIRRERPFVVWGTMNQRRDFIHIDDAVLAIMAIVDSGTDDAVNLCTGIPTTMYDLAKMVMQASGYDDDVVQDLTKPMGVLNRVGDPTRMLEYHTPEIDILEGVARGIKERT